MARAISNAALIVQNHQHMRGELAHRRVHRHIDRHLLGQPARQQRAARLPGKRHQLTGDRSRRTLIFQRRDIQPAKRRERQHVNRRLRQHPRAAIGP